MRQAVLTRPGTFELVDVPVPEIGPEELLVRVGACGVCASELDMYTGHTANTFPIVPGHEVSGVVERVGGDVTRQRPGDRVGIWVTEAGFSDYVKVHTAFALPAGEMPIDLALAEPVACAVNAVEIADPQLGDDVLIVGAGFMGALVLKLVLMRGPRNVIVADTRPEALELARRIGATHTVDVRSERLADVVRAHSDRVPAGTFGMAGKLVIVGYHQGGTREIPLAAWNWKALRVINAHFREVATIMRGMRTGMRLLSSGRLEIDELVTHRFGLEQVGEAFQVAVDKPSGFVKSTVVVEGN
jgi:threonine dehydrogenase-like Zn-dependent dehydrogenase